MKTVNDAFGYSVGFGETYAVTKRSSGNMTVVYGQVEEIHKENNTVTLKILGKASGLYEEDLKKHEKLKRNAVTVLANNLIPVSEEPLWLLNS